MSVILSFFNSRDLYFRCASLGVRHTSNQTDRDMTCSRSCDQGKITKEDGKWKNPGFKKKTIHKGFCFFNTFLGFFEMKQVFVLFLEKNKNSSLNCF